MSGETSLDVLLATLRPELIDGIYVFTTLPDRVIPQGITPRMVFQESEGTSLIVLQSEAEAAGLAFEFPCRMITLNIHSSLEAVGMIARIASVLADAGMGVNPVAGFFHDHLFIPEGREVQALKILRDLTK